MSDLTPTVEKVHAMLRIAATLRADADPLLAGQVEGVIGRLTAMLAVLGEVLPEEALNGGRHG